MICAILTILWIVSAVWVAIVMPIYYLRESRPKSKEEELNELAEACRYYMEKHPEVLDPYRTHQHEESEEKMRESKWYVRLFRRLCYFLFGWLIKEEEIPKAELCRMARESGECHGEFCDTCAWYESGKEDG